MPSGNKPLPESMLGQIYVSNASLRLNELKYLTYTFGKSKFSATDKLTNGVLVTPTPEAAHSALKQNRYVTKKKWFYFQVILGLHQNHDIFTPIQLIQSWIFNESSHTCSFVPFFS